jgi:hypothetical protein
MGMVWSGTDESESIGKEERSGGPVKDSGFKGSRTRDRALRYVGPPST